MTTHSETTKLFLETPIGTLEIKGTVSGLTGVRFVDDGGENSFVPDSSASNASVEEAVRQLSEYFNGQRIVFDLPLDMSGTPFQRRVWDEIGGVPYGKTISYKQLAAAAERPSSVRAAGTATGRNSYAIIVPCHRIVGSSGAMHGYAWGLERKRWLLAFEETIAGKDKRDEN